MLIISYFFVNTREEKYTLSSFKRCTTCCESPEFHHVGLLHVGRNLLNLCCVEEENEKVENPKQSQELIQLNISDLLCFSISQM